MSERAQANFPVWAVTAVITPTTASLPVPREGDRHPWTSYTTRCVDIPRLHLLRKR